MGAPVLTDTVNLYYIYYGNWTDSQKATLDHFGSHISSSSWYNIEKKYYYQADARSAKKFVNGNVVLKKTVVDNYSRGKVLNGTALPDIIQAQIDAGHLPEDSSAVYFVLTSGDVAESIRPDLGRAAFCYSYCGYHVSWKLKSGTRIFYSQVGNPTACLDGCAPHENSKVSPNGDFGVDAMTSVIAHELVEAVSDPESDGNRAWQDGIGYENGDKCAWTYGVSQTHETGYKYNLVLGERNYYIQRNWYVNFRAPFMICRDPELQACANEA